MNQSNPGTLFCDMTVFSPEERAHHVAAIKQMLDDVLNVQPMKNGYALRCATDAAVLLRLATFIAGERLCCPFLNFQLEVEPAGATWLRLTGGEGAKEFLQIELGGFAGDRLQFN